MRNYLSKKDPLCAIIFSWRLQVEFGHSLVTFSDDMGIFVPLESIHKLATDTGCDRCLA